MSNPRYPLASVDHALRILDHLRGEPVVRLSDIARELEVANSTAHRLLAALSHRGYVEQDPKTRLYRSGPVLRSIGRAAVLHDELRTRLHPVLGSLCTNLGETVHLGVREGKAVRYVDAVESSRAVRVAARTGRTLPAHWTSTGKMLLAALTDDSVRRLYGDDPLPTGTPASIGNLKDLLTDLDRCRRAGYAVNCGESEDDVVSVAVPLCDDDGLVVAAVSCAAPRHRLAVADAESIALRIRQHLESGAA